MKNMNVTLQMKQMLDPKKDSVKARLFVTREDGITIYDTVQDQTTTSVAALVSGVWHASEAMMGLVKSGQDAMEFRLGFDTSSQGIYLFPFSLKGKRYFLGAIYSDCVNPGQLKRQVAMIKEEMDRTFESTQPAPKVIKKENNKVNNLVPTREGFLFADISDAEIDKLFAVNGI